MFDNSYIDNNDYYMTDKSVVQGENTEQTLNYLRQRYEVPCVVISI